VLVGAGPGDPGLLTLSGQRALQEADIVVTDALVNPRLWQGLRARIIDVGKRGPGAPQGAHQRQPQSGINKLLVRLAKAGHTVVRLKGGDPFVFGRGSEELEELRSARIAFEVIPGVSSVYAVPAYAGIPITDRRFASHVTVITGHEKGEDGGQNTDWDKISPAGTLVVFMGVSRWPSIQHELLSRHWPPRHPVAAIEWGTTPRQRVIHSRLDHAAQDFRAARLHSPAIVVVGRVAKLGRSLSWFQKSRPLLGPKIVVTRPADQAPELIAALETKGAEVIAAPSIVVRSLASESLVKQRLKLLARDKTDFDLLIFLSANAVRCFAEVATKLSHRLRRTAVAVVGDATARAAREHHWPVVHIPESYSAESLTRRLGSLVGKRCLLPRAQEAPEKIVTALRGNGAVVDVLPIYRTEPVVYGAKLKREIKTMASAVVFTSASSVNGFVRNFKSGGSQWSRRLPAISIGAQTSSALRRAGFKHIYQAPNATIPELVAAVPRRSS
jgi:uroporphyrinogen III methyltransferase/synthase